MVNLKNTVAVGLVGLLLSSNIAEAKKLKTVKQKNLFTIVEFVLENGAYGGTCGLSREGRFYVVDIEVREQPYSITFCDYNQNFQADSGDKLSFGNGASFHLVDRGLNGLLPDEDMDKFVAVREDIFYRPLSKDISESELAERRVIANKKYIEIVRGIVRYIPK